MAIKYTGETFVVLHGNEKVTIEVYKMKGQKVYQALFANGAQIFITKATNAGGHEFWTSVPEGQLELAGQIGELIDNRDINKIQKALF